MKTKLFFFLALTSFSIFSFSQKKYLMEILSPFEEKTYSYGLNDKLETSSKTTVNSETRDEFFYNEKNLCERIDIYQIYKGDWLKSGYIEYKYDDKENRVERKNYNIDINSGEYNQGGILKYTYDNDGKLQYFMTYLILKGEEKPYEKTTYIYNTDKLTGYYLEQNSKLFGDEPEWNKTSIVGYLYDSVGRIIADSLLSQYDENDIRPAAKTEYIYDDNGNLIRRDYYIPSSSKLWYKQNYHVYEYDLSKSAKEYILPINPEDIEPIILTMANERTKDIFYSIDDATGEMALADTYEYKYKEESRIDNIEVSGKFIYPNPVENSFTINFPNNSQSILVYDEQGKLMMSFRNPSSRIEVPNLASGIYWVKCGNYTVKMLKK